MSRPVVSLCTSLYDHYGVGGVGMPYFAKHRDAIGAFDPIDFLVQITAGHDLSWAFEVYLSAPFIWAPFGREQWYMLHRAMCPRPTSYRIFLDTGAYADIHFMLRYLGVNPVPGILNDPLINHVDKVAIVEYLQRSSCLRMVPEADDPELLDGIHTISYTELRIIQQRLTLRGYPAAPTTEADCKEMVQHLNVSN